MVVKKILFYVVLLLKGYGLYWVLTQWPYMREFVSYTSSSFYLSVNLLYLAVFTLWLDLAFSKNKTNFQLISIGLMTFGLFANHLHHKFFLTPIEVDSISILIQPLIWGINDDSNALGFIGSTLDNFKWPVFYIVVLLGAFFIPPFYNSKSFFSNKLAILVWIVVIARSWDSQWYKSPPAFSFYAPIVKSVFVKPLNFEEKEAVKITPKQKPLIKNIVIMMDESVRGDYLSINGHKKKTTPYLEKVMKQNQLITYGVGCAAANYSSTSNALVRFGADYNIFEDGVKHTLHKAASIFQYARHAGVITAYVDCQVAKGSLNDYMAIKETTFIDHFQQKCPTLCTAEVDHKNIPYLVNLLKQKGPQFVIFRKMGSHQPYEKMYPKDRKPLSTKTDDSTERYRENYENALHYKVDDFFQQLLPQIDLKETVIIYTSDHAQAMLETGYMGHGHIDNPPVEEAHVPMVIITQNQEMLHKFSKTKGAKSAFQIFPTVLELMGYDRRDIKTITTVEPLYEKTEELVFLSGNVFITDESPIYKVNQCFTEKKS